MPISHPCSSSSSCRSARGSYYYKATRRALRIKAPTFQCGFNRTQSILLLNLREKVLFDLFGRSSWRGSDHVRRIRDAVEHELCRGRRVGVIPQSDHLRLPSAGVREDAILRVTYPLLLPFALQWRRDDGFNTLNRTCRLWREVLMPVSLVVSLLLFCGQLSTTGLVRTLHQIFNLARAAARAIAIAFLNRSN